MQKIRLLLPFTYGVHADALEYAVLMAQSRDAVLVPLSIIQVANECGAKGARLEYIQQSQDFLAAVTYNALKHGVEVEQKEVYTSDAVACIREGMQTLHCDGVLLLVENGKGVLLRTSEVKHVIASVASQVHLIHIQSQHAESVDKSFIERLASVFAKGRIQSTTTA
ncbi:MAG: hypothetical protein ABI396_07220 [Ktedonobacteraceae bacterium]